MKTAEQWVYEYQTLRDPQKHIDEGTKPVFLRDLFQQAQAEALAEHQRVLDECEKALLPYAQLGGPFADGTKADPAALSAFAEIAKLKGKQG